MRTKQTGLSPSFALLLAVLFVSCSSIATRFTTGAALAVAGWRLGIAAAILFVIPSARRGCAAISSKDIGRIVLAALCLAVHFGAWNASLRMLPLAVSMLLVSTHPVFVLLARGAMGDRWRIPEVVGVTLALAGILVMQRGGHLTSRGVQGATFALLGAAALASYLLVSASVRQRTDTPAFLLLVYGMAALMLLGFLAGAGGSIVPPSGIEYGLYAFLALVPTLGGHGLFAYCIGHMRPVAVSVAFLAEPLAASLIAIPVFHEIPPASTVFGGLAILCGLGLIVLTSRREADLINAAGSPEG